MTENPENFDTTLLDDPDQRFWERIKMGLEPDISFEEYSYFFWEDKLKTLAKQKGWVRNSAAPASSSAKGLTTLPNDEGHHD